MEMDEIIVIDEGLEEAPNGPDSFCCVLLYVPYRL